MLKAHKEEEMIAMAAAVVNSIAAMSAVHKDELLYRARHEMSAASGPRDENTSHAEYRIVAFARSYLPIGSRTSSLFLSMEVIPAFHPAGGSEGMQSRSSLSYLL